MHLNRPEHTSAQRSVPSGRPGAVILLFAAALLAPLVLTACGDAVGTPCTITGSGFTARHDCRHRCLSRWQITCPDGESITPGTCTGAFDCQPGSCPEGQVCYHDDDPFDDRSFCIMADTCGVLDGDALRRWELDRVAAQAAVKAERAAKEARRAQWRAENPDASTTAPAATPAAKPPEQTKPSITEQPIAAAAPSPKPPPLPCSATEDRAAFHIPQAGSESDAPGLASLTAGRTFEQALPHDWRFALVPSEHGWSIRVFDRSQDKGRVDMSAVTPPYRGPANARELEGWHFRNAANDGPNEGDVNAPQELRLFLWDTGLIGTGGFRPPRPGNEGSVPDAEGRGWLRLVDYELSPAKPGTRARFESIRFEACLTWPKPSEATVKDWNERRENSLLAHDANDPEYTDEEREMIGSCGLDFGRFTPSGRVLPRSLGLDIDGDGSHDAVYQVARAADGSRAIALCRARTWIDLLDSEHPLLQDADLSILVSAMEAWRVVPGDHGKFGYEGEPEWPNAAGDVLVIERKEKGLGIVFWADGALRAQSVYRYVEP